jgi:hypothetical protein
MNDSLDRQEEIFSQALSLPAGEQAAYLDQMCWPLTKRWNDSPPKTPNRPSW